MSSSSSHSIPAILDRIREARSRCLTISRGLTRTLRRQGLICALCRQSFVAGDCVTRDHIIPVSRGGKNSERNIQAAHLSCNRERGNMTMDEWRKHTSRKSVEQVRREQAEAERIALRAAAAVDNK